MVEAIDNAKAGMNPFLRKIAAGNIVRVTNLRLEFKLLKSRPDGQSRIIDQVLMVIVEILHRTDGLYYLLIGNTLLHNKRIAE